MVLVSPGSARGGGQTSNGHVGRMRDGIACLDALAAQMDARGWTAYINTPAGRLTFLSVQDPHDRAECNIMVAPAGATGDWWYWFSWAERIAPVHAPATAAEAIIRAVQRPADGPLGATLARGGRPCQGHSTPAGRLAFLLVQDPHDRAECCGFKPD